MVKRILPILLAALLLTGCQQKVPVRVVESIVVTAGEGPLARQRVYRQEEAMRPVLNALRLLGSRVNPDRDPENLPIPCWRITLIHSDGSHRDYRLRGSRSIQENQGAWQQCDPDRMEDLILLLRSLPEPPL